MADTISSNADLTDVHNIIERFKELKGERDNLQSIIDEGKDDSFADAGAMEDGEAEDAARLALDEWKADNGDELEQLRELLGKAGMENIQ